MSRPGPISNREFAGGVTGKDKTSSVLRSGPISDRKLLDGVTGQDKFSYVSRGRPVLPGNFASGVTGEGISSCVSRGTRKRLSVRQYCTKIRTPEHLTKQKIICTFYYPEMVLRVLQGYCSLCQFLSLFLTILRIFTRFFLSVFMYRKCRKPFIYAGLRHFSIIRA